MGICLVRAMIRMSFYILSDVKCTGDEERLINCSYTTPYTCVHSEDAAISCINASGT